MVLYRPFSVAILYALLSRLYNLELLSDGAVKVVTVWNCYVD